MPRLLTMIAILGWVVLGATSPALAQADFQWSGQLSTAQLIEIKGINGDVRAMPAPGSQVEVSATRRANRSDPTAVRIEVVPHSRGITICAVYPTDSGRDPNTCEPGSGGRSNVRNNDTVVNFTVRVPAGVSFIGRTVNGDVDGDSLRGYAEGRTVNGSVTLSTTEAAVANTVNGSITASMGRADWPDGAAFKTVNGSITLRLGGAVNANVRAETVNGGITTDFPITVTGSIGPRRLSGTIGGGGRELNLSTVNGSIKLYRSP